MEFNFFMYFEPKKNDHIEKWEKYFLYRIYFQKKTATLTKWKKMFIEKSTYFEHSFRKGFSILLFLHIRHSRFVQNRTKLCKKDCLSQIFLSWKFLQF